MSAEIIKVYKESHPPLRIIGKRYTQAERDPETGLFSPRWGEWFAAERFAELEALTPQDETNGGAYIGLIGNSDENNSDDGVEYWIGMFFPRETPVPEGFDSADIPASEVGVCWLHGTEPKLYTQSLECAAALLAEDMPVPRHDELGRWWEFERYNCPRFTEPDADGKIILDYGVYLKRLRGGGF
jgi:predicted transcriptional regulator YdeE